MFPYRSITAVAVGGAYLVSSGRIPQLPPWGFLSSFGALLALQLSAWVVWSVILYPKFLSPLIGLPEPSGNSWFMGQFPEIIAKPGGVPQMEWTRTVPNDGLIRYLGPFNQERILLTSPKALAEVLVTKNYDFVKPSVVRHSIGKILGIGVLLAEGDEHKMQRKNLLPAFAFRHIKDLYPVFWNQSRKGVQAMTEQILSGAADRPEAEKNTAVIEVSGWASRITLDIIGVAGFGCDFDAINNPTNPLTQAYKHVFSPSREARFLQVLSIITHPRIVAWLPMKRNAEIRNASSKIREECAKLIREKKAKLASKQLTDVDILSVALESGGFTDENLVDQLMTFLAAGHETTASATTWAAYLLAKHTDVQDRLRAEIRAHLPSPSADDNSQISSLDIDRMPYLNAVCSETLRYFSPVPTTFREAACDTSILGTRVPRGTRIIMAPWATNRSEFLWGPDAREFNPDRWLPDPSRPDQDANKRAASGGAESNYAFLTFLHGPRSCIGQGFAKAEFACLLATWVGRFRLELHNEEERDEEKVEIKGGVTARPAKGMYLRTTVVEGW